MDRTWLFVLYLFSTTTTTTITITTTTTTTTITTTTTNPLSFQHCVPAPNTPRPVSRQRSAAARRDGGDNCVMRVSVITKRDLSTITKRDYSVITKRDLSVI